MLKSILWCWIPAFPQGTFSWTFVQFTFVAGMTGASLIQLNLLCYLTSVKSASFENRTFGRGASSAARYPIGSMTTAFWDSGRPRIFPTATGSNPSIGHESIWSSAQAAIAKPWAIYVCFADQARISVGSVFPATNPPTISSYPLSMARTSGFPPERRVKNSSFSVERSVRAVKTRRCELVTTWGWFHDAAWIFSSHPDCSRRRNDRVAYRKMSVLAWSLRESYWDPHQKLFS